MKIRNEQHFPATNQSVLQRHGIQIGSATATTTTAATAAAAATTIRPTHKPNIHTNINSNGKLQNAKHQECCCNNRLVNNNRILGHLYCQRIPKRPQATAHQLHSSTLITSHLINKLAQLCLVIALLLPFLITTSALIQQASGQSILVPMSNSNSNLNPSNGRKPVKMPQTGYDLTSAHNNNSSNNSNHNQNTNQQQHNDNIYNNSNIFKQYYNQRSINRNSNVTTAVSAINRSEPHSNPHSLIILSQAANRISLFNSTVAANSNSNRNRNSNSRSKNISNTTNSLSINSNALHHAKNASHFVNSQLSTVRSRRDLYTNHKRKSLADNRLILSANENNKANKQQHRHNKSIDQEKLTKLVMTGLGLKKLPDMRKANISQVEYARKYYEYLKRLQYNQDQRRGDGFSAQLPAETAPEMLHIFSIETNSFSDITDKRWRHKRAARAMAKKQPQHQSQKKKSQNASFAARDKTNILLHFPLSVDDAHFHSDSIDEANVRLMLLYSSSLAAQRWATKKKAHHQRHNGNVASRRNCEAAGGASSAQAQLPGYERRKKARVNILNLKVYLLLSANRRELLDSRKLEFESSDYGASSDETRSQWLEFDVTRAVRGWLNKSHENLGIEIQCDKCRRIGARILSDVSAPASNGEEVDGSQEEDDRYHLRPVLNIIGRLGHTHREGGVHQFNTSDGQAQSYFHHSVGHSKHKPNSCYKAHQRCCRHQLDVAFKDVKGFEFILQPKMFDAGYCQGRCPPRHNPAHHHALLQSLIWEKDHSRVPRPCCAPSKLAELEVLHVDEEHSDKLKITTWTDMQVLECACT